jgi:outer membrane protein TolC
LEAQRLTEQAEAQDILHETALRYYALERSLADLRAAQEQLAETQENLTISQAQGMGPDASLDALQLETQKAEAEEQLAQAQSASEMAALSLNELLMLPAFVDTLPVGEQDLHTLVPTGTDFQASLSQALENNPSLKAQEKQIKAYSQLLKAAIVTGVLPSVQMEYNIGSVGANRDETGRYNSSASRIAFTDKNLGISGIFGYRELKAKMSAMRNQLTEQRSAIQRMLSEAQVKAHARQAQVEIDRQRLALSQKTRDAAIAQLKEGKAHGLTLFQAQAMLNTVRHHMNEMILQYNEAQVEIVYALGVASVETLSHGLRPTSIPPTQVSNNLPGN